MYFCTGELVDKTGIAKEVQVGNVHITGGIGRDVDRVDEARRVGADPRPKTLPILCDIGRTDVCNIDVTVFVDPDTIWTAYAGRDRTDERAGNVAEREDSAAVI